MDDREKADGVEFPNPLQVWLPKISCAVCEQVITLEHMVTVKRTVEFDDWLASIKDGMTRIRLAKRLDKVQRGLLGDVEPVGEGVCEMREFFGPGWRMYYIERNGVIIVMLGGGDKSTQQADIAMAIALSKTIEE